MRVSFNGDSGKIIIEMANICVLHPASVRSYYSSFLCISLQIHNEDDGSGGQAVAEPSASSGAGGRSVEGQTSWVNSLVGRIFWDFLREKYWTDQVAVKIQKKLSKIKVRTGIYVSRKVEFLGDKMIGCSHVYTFIFIPPSSTSPSMSY